MRRCGAAGAASGWSGEEAPWKCAAGMHMKPPEILLHEWHTTQGHRRYYFTNGTLIRGTGDITLRMTHKSGAQEILLYEWHTNQGHRVYDKIEGKVGSFTPRPLYPRERTSCMHSNGPSVGPREGFGVLNTLKVSRLCRKSNQRPSIQ
jgi:hypothetical protein